MAREILAATLLTWHNLYYYQEIMVNIRDAIAKNNLDAFVSNFTIEQAAGDIEQI